MSQIFANFFRGDSLLFELAVALVGTLGPAVLRAGGARLLWLSAAGIWLVVFLAIRLFHTAGADLLGFLALWLGLMAAVALLLAKLHWPVAVQSLVGVLIAIALPAVSVYTVLYLAYRYGPGAP